MHVLGTAGHVDHGKSSLVRALTGTDPDRWLEEKLRGMTLDLGFAHLRFPDGVEAGIVDVPGHEGFVHNMLAGAAGMELVMLVIAATEGPKPQTFEHLAILQHLNVRRTIVALTKSDLLDDTSLAEAVDATRAGLVGTIAANATIVPVSTMAGDGLDVLRAALHDALVALPQPDSGAPAYLPVDRAFTLAGHGTIVTGTLMQGRISVGDRLELTPLLRTVRVRSLQVFGTSRATVDAGARVAANLVGVERSELERGMVLASTQLRPLGRIAVRFRAEPEALSLLVRRTPVRAHIGSAEILGTLVFDRAPTTTDAVDATLFLRTPTVVVPGASFVVRRPSPKTLLGGGNFANDQSGGPRDVVVAEVAVREAQPETRERIVVGAALLKAGINGSDAPRVGALANILEETAATVLEELVGLGRAVRLVKPDGYADVDAIDSLVSRVRDALGVAEAETPWRLGTTSLALSRSLEIPEPVVIRALGVAVTDGRLGLRDGYYATPDFVPALSADQRAFFDVAFPRDPAHPLIPVPFDEVIKAVRGSKIAGLSAALDTLLGSRAVVKVGDSLYRGDQIDELRARLVSTLRERKQITPAEFRDVAGTSRKYVVPLLEWFDATGVTLRSGDTRILRIQRPRP